MHTRTIYKLLVEASTADVHRFNEIQCELGHATEAFDKKLDCYKEDERSQTISALVDGLFCKVGLANPAALPAMLPFFDMVCNVRESKHWLNGE